MRQKILSFVSLLCLLTLSLCSCFTFFSDRGTFYGGQMLDNELLSEIRQNVLGTGEKDTSDISYETAETARSENVSSSKQESNDTTSAPAESSATDGESILYWTDGGEVWHASKDCRYLKNKEMISGNQNDALNAGKKRLCSACGNK